MKIKRDSSFAGVIEPEEQAAIMVWHMMKKGTNTPHGVAIGRFDFDDIRTHISH